MKADRLAILILFSLVLPGIACQAASRVLTSVPSPGQQTLGHQPSHAYPTPYPFTAAQTPLPTATAYHISTATVAATATTTDAPTAAATATETPSPSPSPFQFSVFQDLWEAVRDDYLYPNFNGLDWNAVYDRYYQQIQTGMSDSDFYLAMSQMIAELGDDHSAFLDPGQVQAEEAEFSGKNNFVGVGILTTTVPERDRIVIILTFPDSPAERAGLQSHDSILAADGIPVLDESGFRRELLLGESGSQVTLIVQSPGGEPREVQITRGPVSGPMPVPHTSLETVNGKRVGYILIPTFADDTIDEQVAQAIQELSVGSPLHGLILDNRHNSGGADNVARDVLSFFTSGRLGFFVDRHQFQRPMRVSSDDIAGSNRMPLVVLVGPDTISFGEIFSGILRDVGRAYLIGQPTEGNIELLWGYDFEDGSRAWIARETFRPLNHPDQDWETTGIIPDLILSSNWDEVTTESDPLIKAALEYLDGR